jgi:hypothetical protein
LLGIGLAIAVCSSAGWARSAADSPTAHAAKSAPIPDREREYAALIEKARADYRAARTDDSRSGTRVSLQINVHRFMGLTHNAQDWVGIYKGGKRLDDGARSIEIEITPGVTVATWDTAVFDQPYQTMVKSYAPLSSVLDKLTIGQPVIFSADLLGNAVGSDEDMVMHPRVIAKFTKLAKRDDK